MLTNESSWQSGMENPASRNERRMRSISKDPPAAYFSQPEEACRAADILEMKQIQILVIQN